MACNHRCTFCALDFMQYKPRFLDAGLLKTRLAELGRLGLKSVMFAGEGEPFLHRDMAGIAEQAKASGIDVAFTTNGVLLKPAISERVLGVTEWIKVSCNAARPETYAKIHGTSPDDLTRVFDNLAAAAAIRRREGYRCTLGMQILLLPENEAEVPELARRARDAGLDYLVVKPYSQHPQSLTEVYKGIRYQSASELAEELAALRTPSFTPVVRLQTITKWNERERPYRRCQALPFWSYLDAGGNVWGCSMFLGDERFRYGNIAEQSFEAIWTGAKRRDSLAWFDSEFDPAGCRINCRLDEINRYLWELKNPPLHVNFI